MVMKKEDDLSKSKESVEKRHPPTSIREMTSAETLSLAAAEGKFSKPSSGYKPVSETEYRVCATCVHFQRADEGEIGECRVVEGDIPWFATSDHFISAMDESNFAFSQATKQGFMLRATALGASMDAMTMSEEVEKRKKRRRSVYMAEEDLVEKKIVSRDGKFCVTSQDGSRNFGCYGSREAAQRRLGQIEGFKAGKSVDEPEDLVQKEYLIPIAKVDEEKRLVSGVVLEPDTVDAQGDIISAEEIEKTAHNFMLKSRTIGKGHKNKADAAPVESHITSQDVKIGKQSVRKGAWVLTVKLNDDSIWEGVKSGEYTGFSIGGFGKRTPLTPAA
jgi:hypothetical protein